MQQFNCNSINLNQSACKINQVIKCKYSVADGKFGSINAIYATIFRAIISNIFCAEKHPLLHSVAPLLRPLTTKITHGVILSQVIVPFSETVSKWPFTTDNWERRATFVGRHRHTPCKKNFNLIALILSPTFFVSKPTETRFPQNRNFPANLMNN